MTDELRDAIIAALRDTAIKVSETKKVKRLRYDDSTVVRYQPQLQEVEEDVEAYSKDWLAGRLLGMADMIEAMTE